MSYSPFSVLGTSARIKANRNRIKQIEPKEEEKKEIDYTEQFRKTYFPHLVKEEKAND